MDHPVSTSHLKLDGPNESCTSRGFKVPRKKICPECWNFAGIDKAELGIRRHF
jgi:hypothetical protein